MKSIKVYHADWCGACGMFFPVIGQVVHNKKNVPPITYVDVDKEWQEASKMGIRGIPTVIIYDGTDIVAEKVGAMTAEQFDTFISEHL